MHLLDKADRDFDQHERRDIRNVRCRSCALGSLTLTSWPCAVHQLAHQAV